MLEAWQAERADFERLLGAIRRIQAAPETDLRSVSWLVERIREVGLVAIPDAETTYGEDAAFLNASQQGVIQIPAEFARLLLLLGERRPASYLEIGTFNGATATLAVAYLQRFNPDLRATTLDLFPAFLFYSEVQALLPCLQYEIGRTSFDFRAELFEAVLIDGDHSFEWAWADYQNVGRRARVCALHDVNNEPYRELPLGGVTGVWDVLKREAGAGKLIEIFEHESGLPIMGIGVRVAG